MIDDINTKRTELANQMAAAGAALLDFTGTACSMAAIPDTEPQQYVAAGTPENIAAILPATIGPQRRQKHGERPTAALQFEGYDGDTGAPVVKLLGDVQPGDKLYRARPAATSGDAPDLQQLKALALAATPQNFDSAQIKRDGGEIECPACGGEGTVERGNDYCNYDNAALGATFYGIGEEHRNAEAYYRAVRPAVVLGLIAHIERTTAHVQPVNTSIERVENAAGNEQVESAASGATASGDELTTVECPTCNGHGLIGGHSGQTPESYEEHTQGCDDCDGQGRVIVSRADLAAVSAATKPTADLELHNRIVQRLAWLAEGRQIGVPAFVADVQSLLATKPAAAPTDYREVLANVRAALQRCNDRPGGGIADTLWMPGQPETIFDYIDAALADSPTASTTGSAQTA